MSSRPEYKVGGGPFVPGTAPAIQAVAQMVSGADSVARPALADNSHLGIAANALVVAGPGRLFKVSVVVAGSGAGAVYDVAADSASGSANQFGTIPNTVGTYTFDWPFANGLAVHPGTGSTVSVSTDDGK